MIHDYMKLKFLLLACFSSISLNSQTLVPGFDPEEYRQLLLISTRIIDSPEYQAKFPDPDRFSKVYRSMEMGLDNLWELWINEEHSIGVISIRGTNASREGWLLNFYSAMLPATGEISWGTDSNRIKFPYKLSDNPQAAVHAGWLVGTAFLYRDMQLKLDSLYSEGVKDYYLVGHSQGGGIAYMLTAYLRNAQISGEIAEDITWKTYCSAAPKPGNLPFAYSYEAMTQDGWAFNVVNAKDWVPEVPFSIQTLDDFNPTNPFVNVEEILDQQAFSRRIVMKHIYRKLDKPTRKAQRNFEKFLGDVTEKLVEESIIGLEVPSYYHSNNYVRTGTQIVLTPDESYSKIYPDTASTNSFIHHDYMSYLYLVNAMKTPFHLNLKENDLAGKWTLTKILEKAASDYSHKGQMPFVQFDLSSKQILGFGGCNNFSGTFTLSKEHIIIGPLRSTKMFCGENNIERDFFSALDGELEYQIDNGRLNLLQNEQIILTFKLEKELK